jgi:hypothetical protein
MRLTLALLISLAACGGSSKPAAAPADPPPPSDGEASCCCDYIREEGDPAGDDWSENQTYELMDPAGCADLSGQCTDEASCSAS